MSEALIGVLLGGIIGWIAPLLTLRHESIKSTVLELASAMKRDLRAKDDEIRKLLNQP